MEDDQPPEAADRKLKVADEMDHYQSGSQGHRLRD